MIFIKINAVHAIGATGQSPDENNEGLVDTSPQVILAVLRQLINKGGVPEEAIYIGDEQLESLVAIKSKEELIGEIINLLQSPAKNVVSALQSGGGKLAGILQTLSEKGN